MLLKPKWFKMLRYECRPSLEKINILESLRKQNGIPHEAICMRIMSSPSITRQLQKELLIEAKAEMPESDEKELWKVVLISRLRNYVEQGFESPDILKNVDKIIRKAKSFDEICDFIIELDQKQPSYPDPFGIGEMIDKILEK